MERFAEEYHDFRVEVPDSDRGEGGWGQLRLTDK